MLTRTILCVLLALPTLLFSGEAETQIDALIKQVADGNTNAPYNTLVSCKSALPFAEAVEKNETDPLKKSRLARLLRVMRTREIMERVYAALHQPGGMEYELEATMQIGGQKIQAKGHGTFAEDGKHFRLETLVAMPGQQQKALLVGDGEKIFREDSALDKNGKVVAQQANFTAISALQKPSDIPKNEVLNEFDRIQREMDVYSAEETKVDGEDVIVLKAVSNMKRDRPIEEIDHTGRIVLRKSDFLPLSSDDTSPANIQQIRFTSIKMSGKLDETLFIYKAPNGLQVENVGAGPKK